MSVTFTKAVRRKTKLRLAFAGPSGSGKTLSALMIAKSLGGRIAVIDSERGSASLYAAPVRLPDGKTWTPPEFDTLDLVAPYTPESFIDAIAAAEKAGYDICIIDSATHEWNGVGGCLEIVDKVAAQMTSKNTWAAFNQVTPRHRKFIDRILQSSMHMMATLRSKTETVQAEDERRPGKKTVVKLGMKAEQRDGLEYEFTTVLELQHDTHIATTSKDRTGVFAGDPEPVSDETGLRLLAWLGSGAELKPEPKADEPGADPWAAHIEVIETAATVGGLRTAHAAAFKAATEAQDAAGIARINAAKDARKVEFAAPEVTS
jgi:DNA polymerase III delta prime subunit